MPKPHANATADGVSVITRGMHSGVAPRLVAQNQLAFAINVTCRNGLPRTRPVWKKLTFTAATELLATAASEGLFQDASCYEGIGVARSCIIASISGRIFRFNVDSDYSVQELTWSGDLQNPLNPNAWMWQAEEFLIIQDGQANPLLFDGAGIRRSGGVATEELPPGCMGAYVQGRIWQSNPDRNGFMAGDLVYSHGFTGSYGGRDAVLKTEENTFLSGGGAFAVPMQAGRITSMANVAIADTSLGQGPLQVTTQTAVFSVQTPILREAWAVTEYPLMTIGLPNYGAVGQSAITAVNGDLWYRSLDGIRSYQVARRDFNTWVNTPQSVEMEAVLNQDDERLLERTSAVLFDNRLLVTCSPYEAQDRGVAHRGLIALDFNNISNLTTRSDPAYDGLWTGVHALKIIKGLFSGIERCFAFGLDCVGRIGIYELLPDGAGRFDWDGTQDVGVESMWRSRALGWQDNGNGLKKLLAADLYIDKLAGPGAGTVDYEFKFATDEDPEFKDWHSFSLCAPVKDCTTEDCPTFTPVRDQYRTYLRLPDPPDICSEITGRMTRTAYEFQIQMWWKGYMQLNRLHAWALPMVDSVVTACPGSETCRLLKSCEESWFTYTIDDCSGAGGAVPGILWEGSREGTGGVPPFISTEGGVIVRKEDQYAGYDQGGEVPESTGSGGSVGGTPVPGDFPAPRPAPNPVPEPSPVPVPVWPTLPVYGCAGEQTIGAVSVYDAVRAENNFVGVPDCADPQQYVLDNGMSRCLTAWTSYVWSQFIALGIPYSQARVEWDYLPSTQTEFLGTEVFPNQPGNYTKTICPWKLTVRYCPL